MHVQPQNSFERAFAITILVFGLVIFSSFVSSITASMTQLRNMSEDKSKQFWLLRRYLRQRNINKSLSFRILRYLEYACREQKDMVPESKVYILGYLSMQLRHELQYEVSFSSMMTHPLFERARIHSQVTMNQLASVALKQTSLALAETLFTIGIDATHMFIVSTGTLNYLQSSDVHLLGVEESGEDNSKVTKDDFICEASLWVKWVHLGFLRAASDVRLVAIDVTEFTNVVARDPVALSLACAYADQYVAWLNGRPCGKLTDIVHKDEGVELAKGFVNTAVNFISDENAHMAHRGSADSSWGAKGALNKSIIGSLHLGRGRLGVGKSQDFSKICHTASGGARVVPGES